MQTMPRAPHLGHALEHSGSLGMSPFQGCSGLAGCWWVLPRVFRIMRYQEITYVYQPFFKLRWYPSEKYESQLGWLFPIYGEMKNVPNHQPAMYINRFLVTVIWCFWSMEFEIGSRGALFRWFSHHLIWVVFLGQFAWRTSSCFSAFFCCLFLRTLCNFMMI